MCTSNTGLVVNTIAYGLLAFSKARYFTCINRETCVHPEQ